MSPFNKSTTNEMAENKKKMKVIETLHLADIEFEWADDCRSQSPSPGHHPKDPAVRSKLGEKFKCTEACMARYATAVMNAPRSGAEIVDEASALVRHQVPDTNGNELGLFAGELRERHRLLEAVMVLEVAVRHFASAERNHAVAAFGIRNRGRGLLKCAKALIKTADVRHLAEDHVIPLMEGFVVEVERLGDCVVRDTRAAIVADLLLGVVDVHLALGNCNTARRVCDRGVRLLESAIPGAYATRCVYGRLSARLGAACAQSSRHADAARYFSQALNAFQLAADFPTEAERRLCIEQCERCWKTSSGDCLAER